MRTEMIFDRVDDARRVNRKLRDYGVLSRVIAGVRGQKPELWIEVTKHGEARDRALAQRIYRGEA